MKRKSLPLIVSTLAFISLPALLSAQTLLHRYSFVSDASDSVGGATWNGTQVAGNNPATIANGLALPGTGTSGTPSGYVSLPNGIVAGDTNGVTVECWVTQNAVRTWSEIWSFGTSGGTINFGLIPSSSSGNMRAAFTPNGGEVDINAPGLPSGVEEYVAVTYNPFTTTGNLYLNGVIDSGPGNPGTATIATNHSPGTYTSTADSNFGRDPFAGDNQFNGTIYELRIWNGPVSQRYLAASTLAGPSVVITNLTPTSVSVTAGSNVVITGTEQLSINVNLSQSGTNYTNLLATGDATNWVSGNTNILTVNSSGLVSGVAPGTTTVSATVGGVTSTSGNITVAPQTLVHRYSFISDASDSVGGANGTIIGPTGTNAPATITNGLSLPGSGGGTVAGYVTLPTGIVAGDSSVTVECWMTQNAPETWAEVWDFGVFGGAATTNFALIPVSPTPNMRAAFEPNNGEDDVVSSVPFPSGTEEYVAVTYNNSNLKGALYTNAVVAGTFTFPNITYSPGSYGGVTGTTTNYLGADRYGDAQFDGTMYELRIWNGAVTPLYLAASTLAGPAIVVTNLVPTSVAVTVVTNMAASGTQQASVAVNLPQTGTTNVPATTSATNWTSSNTNAITVNSSGLISAAANGGGLSGTVSATVNGVTATSASITVSFTAPIITTQPVSQFLNQGDTAVLMVGAVGGGLTYQWYFGASAISGATSSSLTLSNISLGSAGSYSVTVSNTIGSSNSISAVLSDAPILLHRYSFVSDASDSVGGAGWNGTQIAGNNPATIANGLSLPGTGTSGTPSGYVSLPNGIVSGDTNGVTVECWVTQNAIREWSEIWSFGVSGGSVNFGLIPSSSSGNMRVAFTPGGGEVDINSPGLPVGTEEYVAVTYDNTTLTGNLYLNGLLDSGAGNPGTVTLPSATYSPGRYNTTEDVFGLDPFGGDDQFNGTIYELRIWNGAVTPLYLAVSAAAGPSMIVTNVTLQSGVLNVNTNMTYGGTQQAIVDGTFDQATNVILTGLVTNWASSATNVLTVSGSGLVTAVGGGSATISATVAGFTASASITVQAGPFITQEPATNVEIISGGTLNATVVNIGEPPFTYTWYYNGGAQPISGATSATLVVPDVQDSNAGSYTVIISNAFGSATSTPSMLTVIAPTPYESSLLAFDPVAFWPLNETSGTTAFDVVNGYNGTYIGNVGFQQSGPANAEFGNSSYGVNFDGSTTYVDIPEGPFNITGPVTVTAWVQLLGFPNNFGDVIGHGDTSYRISVNPSGYPAANDGAPPADATSPTEIVDGSWHFLAYTYNGNISDPNNGLLYLDSMVVASNSVFSAPAGNALDVWIAGAPDYGTARLFAGNIADVAIFPQALSAGAIGALFTGQPVLSIERTGTNVVISWSTGTLLQSTNLANPWTTNSAAVSPYTTPATNAAQFYKVQVP